MFMKLTMAKASSKHERINYNKLGKIEKPVNNLSGTFYSKSRVRLRHARTLNKCRPGHGWIDHNHMSKTSLLKVLKTSMDLTVASCLHGIKITAGK